MDPGDREIPLDEFLTWKVDALRDFLTKRGLSKDGTKNELAALCFSVHKLKMPVVPSASDILKQNELDYHKLLSFGTTTIPDPLELHNNWLDEKNGISMWPPIYISNIISYLSSNSSKAVLQDYKIGKAYEYYKNDFLKEVFYHNIEAKSEFCLMRTECLPSQRIRDEPHNIWICVHKSSGQIMSSFCTCTAGLAGTCNHVAALLFRVEAANRLGMVSCTSGACGWKTPSKKEWAPVKIKDIDFKKSRHGDNAANKRPLFSRNKHGFQPVEVDRKDMFEALTSSIRKSLPNACIFKGIDQLAEKASLLVPENVTINLDALSVKSYIHNVQPYTSTDIDTIQLSTIGQSDNENWHLLREDRLTSSNFYSIYTAVQAKKSEDDYVPLITRLMGYKKPSLHIKSLKHGREMEPEAKEQYIKIMKKSGHTNIVTNECGLFVDKDHPYLGATPDLLVQCQCCGAGVVEIKCPLVEKCNFCCNFCTCKLPVYLILNNNQSFSLKTNHQYYAQIQGQLAITGRKYCDFFVYTCNGSVCIRINFDETFYHRILESLIYFFNHYIKPEILSRKIRSMFEICESLDGVPNHTNSGDVNMEVDTVFFCPLCRCLVKESENVENHHDQSIFCDVCELWYHFRCVKITKQSAAKITVLEIRICNSLARILNFWIFSYIFNINFIKISLARKDFYWPGASGLVLISQTEIKQWICPKCID